MRFAPATWRHAALGTTVLLLLALLRLIGGPALKQRLEEPESWKPLPCSQISVPFPRIEDMTLAEKVGQMVLVGALALKEGDDLIKLKIGNVLSGGGEAPPWGKQPKDWAVFTDHLQAKALQTRLRIPMLYGIDAVHGHNNVLGATIFPHHIGLGAGGDAGMVREVGAAAAKEVAATGIRWAFSPAVSVCKNPRWGRCYESFSENTEWVRKMTTEVDGWQGKPANKTDPVAALPGEIFVAACAKHYCGDGATFEGVNGGDIEMEESELRSVHLAPYRDAISRGVQTVMIGYHRWWEAHMHGHYYMITQVLKEELGFGGLVCSDYNAIQFLPGDNATQARTAINAGLDMIMISTEYRDFINVLTKEVEEGRVPMSRIDDAVSRILRVKKKLGLFEQPCAPVELLPSVGSPEHRAVARRAVQKSMVLLKNTHRNGGAFFPLRAEQGTRVLVSGGHAHDIGNQCGGWTITWQGGGGNITQGTTIYEGIVAATRGTGTSIHLVEQPGSSVSCGGEDCSYAVVVVGEPPYAESDGDSIALQLDASAQSAITNSCQSMPCVVVLLSGRPVEMYRFIPMIDALVAAWLPGTEGDGVADVLYGKNDFSATLPMAWFAKAAHLAVNPLSAKPLFPVGYGLSKSGNILPHY